MCQPTIGFVIVVIVYYFIVLLNGMSVLPHSFESIAYGINKKKSTKVATNVGANNAKCNNYELIQEKVKYNMKMLHKQAYHVSSLLFYIFELFC